MARIPRGKGWFNEPRRHSLSAKGIPNAPSKQMAMDRSMSTESQNFIKSLINNTRKQINSIEKSQKNYKKNSKRYIELQTLKNLNRKQLAVLNKSIGKPLKSFYEEPATTAGSSKYVIRHWDGKQRYNDGSKLYGIRFFNNKKDLAAYKEELLKKGYVEE